jgi:predicted TIM-barrel fold metal-dependent hydrolase
MKTTVEFDSSPKRLARRSLFGATLASVLGSVACSRPKPNEEKAAQPARLDLNEYQPKSMLVTAEHPVPRARYPVIDAHTHVSAIFGPQMAPSPDGPDASGLQQLEKILHYMDELNLKTLINVTGGTGENVKRNVQYLQEKHPGRFLVCTEPSYDKYPEPDYPAWQAEQLVRAKQAGAVGLKVLKTLGLVLREKGKEGPLVKVDDPRFDPMWETAGKLNFPVFIHVSDPDAFFLPIDRFNERWEELGGHPDWSFYGKDYPSKKELLEQRNRVIARHPKTIFIGLHVANHPENLDEVSEWFRRYPNLYAEIGARIGELGRQPRRARKFFEEFQDRMLFGTDAAPNIKVIPQQDLTPAMYHCYFRFLETLDEYFDYAPGPIPPQGRWKIYGVGLPDGILKKLYHNNAARLLGLKTI